MMGRGVRFETGAAGLSAAAGPVANAALALGFFGDSHRKYPRPLNEVARGRSQRERSPEDDKAEKTPPLPDDPEDLHLPWEDDGRVPRQRFRIQPVIAPGHTELRVVVAW